MTTRRTQAERSAETIEALIVATLRTLEEVGYTRATTEEIARRAGVSQGALFHHFDTRIDLIAAAVHRHEATVVRIIDEAVAFVGAHGFGVNDDPVVFIEAFVAQVQHPRNAALLEALLGARGDDQLRDDLHRVVDRIFDSVRPLIMRHPSFSGLSSQALDQWIHLFRDYLAGDAMWKAVGLPGEAERDRLQALAEFARRLAA
ncbi:TetR/AcrR family transcriptional regulator [Desertimonas flava]|uniref:TetR/AcrR family transcriptional regulator n=1 Tax=Desertimonas flava TaxID=2064846 RepID=UPI0013C4D329|nr:TetR/AcrR family transcriptional regulator [Desertimonas flava]